MNPKPYTRNQGMYIGGEIQKRVVGARAWLDALAEDGDLIGAGLVEFGAKADVARLDDVQLQLLLAAAVRQLLEAVAQALVHAPLACRGIQVQGLETSSSQHLCPGAYARCMHTWVPIVPFTVCQSSLIIEYLVRCY